MAKPELPESDEFKRPAPPRRAMTIRDLREIVKARDKYLITTKPLDEAMAIIQDGCSADDDSALAFIEWLKGGEASLPATKGAVERIHVKTDPETGLDHPVETQPGSIPPRPA